MLTIPGAASPEPLYTQVADAIGEAVDRRELLPGERLPTQRALARTLGLAITTVTRAYAEAERRGLIQCDVGRGSFVRRAAPRPERATVDLRVNALLPWALERELRAAMQASLADAPAEQVFGYGPPAGAPAHREAAAELLRTTGLPGAEAGRVLLTAGAQHAMSVALLALAEPGDTVLAERVTYPGIKQLAATLRVRLEPVAMDRHGLLPDALRRAARKTRAKFLYCVPTLQNPSSAVLSKARAQELAAVAAEMRLQVIEDDSYGFLLPEAPRLTPLLPSAIFLNGPSKALAPGLRLGVLHAPADLVPRLENALAASVNCASPFAGEIVTAWTRQGVTARVMAWKQAEIAARQATVRAVFAGLDAVTHPASPHVWLPLPPAWTAHRFVSQAAARGVYVSPAERFAVAIEDEPAVRVCLGPPATRAELERALGGLADLLRHGPGAGQPLA